MYDTMETANQKAREAQRRGINSISLRIPAGRRTMALRVDVADVMTEGKDVGAIGLVERRFAQEPPFEDQSTGLRLDSPIDTLIVRVNVADVLEMARAAEERDRMPLRPVIRTRRRRPLGHLMSR